MTSTRASPAEASRRPWLRLLTAAVLIVFAAGVIVTIVRSSDGGHAPAVDTSDWINVVDTAARFTDRLPAQPKDQSVARLDLAGEKAALNIAVVRRSKDTAGGQTSREVIVIEDGELSPALPSSAFAANLREAIFSIAGSSGFQLKTQAQSTFDGHLAWTGTFRSPDGTVLQAVAFMQSGSRMYIILATDSYFKAVTSTFHAM